MKIKRYIFLLAGLLVFQFSLLFASGVSVVVTYPYIGSIAHEIGKDRISLDVLARGDYNPHTIIPKPSFIAKLRGADLVIINGAQLEIGWLPPLLNQANNGSLMPGKAGFLDLSGCVSLIESAKSVSREMGDVHPDGNPHFVLDPHNIPLIALAICDRLSALDPVNKGYYRNNYATFVKKWDARLKYWDGEFVKLKNVRVVEYHRLYDYLLRRYGLIISGTLEPLPGIPPTARHIADIERISSDAGVSFILQDVYNPGDAGAYIARKTGAALVILPHDVGSVSESGDIFKLFDEILRRLGK